MSDPDTVSADYTLRPSELAETLALLVEARQPTILWGAPGCAKSALAQQAANEASRQYLDVRALLLDPVDLRGIPWRRRPHPLGAACIPAARRMITGSLAHQPGGTALGRADGPGGAVSTGAGPEGRREYELPEGASLIACGNRESDRGVVNRMPTPLASRFVHLEIKRGRRKLAAPGARPTASPRKRCSSSSFGPDLLHNFDPQSQARSAFCLSAHLGVCRATSFNQSKRP